MRYSTQDQTTALAGVFHTSELVDKLAKTGQIDDKDLFPSIHSIFILSPNDVAEVYGSHYSLTAGRKALEAILTKNSVLINKDVLRYTLGLIHLAKKLNRRPQMLNIIRERIQSTQKQVEHLGLLHETIISNLANIYVDTISTFKNRIQVSGNALYLHNQFTIDRIRAILLAGIRSATLWRQCGGSRWHLFLNRNRMLDSLKKL